MESRIATRLVESRDASSAYALVAEYYAAASVVACDDRDVFRREYFPPHGAFWIAEVDGQLAGCVGLRSLDSASAELKRMYVRPQFRGCGVGKILLQAVEAFAREKGFRELFLDTASDMHAAARLYEQNGFVRCDRYNNNPQASIFMRKTLTAA